MSQISVTILGIPKPKQSFRYRSIKTSAGKQIAVGYQTKEVKETENNLRAQIVQQLPARFVPFTGPVAVDRLIYVFPPPKSMSKAELALLTSGATIYKFTKPDLTDNLNKALFDAIQGIIFVNDSQVCSLNNIEKVYGFQPRIELQLREIDRIGGEQNKISLFNNSGKVKE